jgi:hypothetical protein
MAYKELEVLRAQMQQMNMGAKRTAADSEKQRENKTELRGSLKNSTGTDTHMFHNIQIYDKLP